SPEGTISQNARGGSSWSRSSARVAAVESTRGSNVRTSWPRRSSLVAMLPPMRPSPIMPSCTSEILQPDAGHAPAPLAQRLEVARGLRPDQAREAERAPRDLQLLPVVLDHLEVEAGVGPALVELPGRVEVAGPEAPGHDAPGRRARAAGRGAQRGLVRRRGLDEGLEADVAAGPGRREELLRRGDVLELGVPGGEHLARPVLRRLHVRLVERVDREHRARDRRRELPAEELLAELVRVGQAYLVTLPVGPVGRLPRGRHEPPSLLARRLGEQLLDPEAEPVHVLEADLVAALPPALPEREPELEAGVALVAAAGLGQLERAVEQPHEVDAEERRRHEPEERERGVAAADRRLPGEGRAEAAVAGDSLELRARVGDRRPLRPARRAPPEVVGVRAGLERRSRLRGGEEERPLEVEPRLEGGDRAGVRGVEDVEAVAAERAPEDLGRERRAAHPEQHDVVEQAGDVLDEREHDLDVLAPPAGLVEPAEPARLVAARPDG